MLVQGGIPGERVRARIERVERQLAFADAVEVLEPSADRREPAMDPACGGCLYAHISYDRQRALKAEIVRDAFARLGRITARSAVEVASSPERGYRMRARLHVRGGRVGFYREGTHELCDAAATGQLDERAVAAAASGGGSADCRGLWRVSRRADREHRRRRARAARAAGGRRGSVRSRAGQRIDRGRVDRVHRAIRGR